jgi:hypothetical protein
MRHSLPELRRNDVDHHATTSSHVRKHLHGAASVAATVKRRDALRMSNFIDECGREASDALRSLLQLESQLLLLAGFEGRSRGLALRCHVNAYVQNT